MKRPAPIPPRSCCALLAAGSLGLANGALGQLMSNPLNPAAEPAPAASHLPAMEMLIEGSVLQKVLIPQYDEQQRLSSLLRARKLTLIHRGLIDVERLRIEFFHPDRRPKGRIDTARAQLEDQTILRSSEPVTLVSDDMNVRGQGIAYDLRGSRGFLHGPAEAIAQLPSETAMKPHPHPHALLGGALLASTAVAPAEGLDKLDPTQMSGLDQLAISRADEAQQAAAASDATLEEAGQASEQADDTLDEFLRKAALNRSDEAVPDLTAKVPDPPAGDGAPRAKIRAEEGIYFDSENGLLIFLTNVEVDHPEFTLRGADEVKVFLQPGEEDAAPPSGEVDGEEAEGLMSGASFGEPSKIVADGTALVLEKLKSGPDDQSAKASGRQLVVDLLGDEAIIRGGQPWVISETFSGRVTDDQGYIRVNLETGDTSAVGDTEIFVPVKEQ